MSIELHHADCFDVFPSIKDGSIDLVLCDPPYGTTVCKWDTVLDLTQMWLALLRIIKPNAQLVFFATQPFTTSLINSNIKMFRYDWTWYKNSVTGISFSKYQPMRCKEDILVFGKTKGTYNPQPTESKIKDRKLGGKNGKRSSKSEHYPFLNKETTIELKHYVNPRNVLEIPVDPMSKGRLHPTQKPIALMEYLVKTYSNEGDTVLDFTMGSGSTGVACKNTNRNFIGIEKELEYYNIAKHRILTEGNEQQEIDIIEQLFKEFE